MLVRSLKRSSQLLERARLSQVKPSRFGNGHPFGSVRTMASEIEKARAAAGNIDHNAPTLFDKIINKEIPADIVFEDDKALAFRDINPQAPVHIILIPKKKDGLSGLSQAREDHEAILGNLLYRASQIAKQEDLAEGYRLVINDGPNGGQSVYHLHLHILGGRQMGWPPG